MINSLWLAPLCGIWMFAQISFAQDISTQNLSTQARDQQPLIANLGAEDYQTRQATEAQFLQLGAEAIPYLDAALTARDPHIRITAERLLGQIRRQATTERVAEFLKKNQGRLPGWGPFAAVVGESDSARRLFGNMYLRFPSVFDKLKNSDDPQTSLSNLWEAYMEATGDLVSLRYQSPRSAAPTATAIFVSHSFLPYLNQASVATSELSAATRQLDEDEVRDHLLACLRAINNERIVLLNKSSSHYQLLQKLLDDFIARIPSPLGEPRVLPQLVQVIRNYELSEQVELLFSIVGSTELTVSTRALALETIGVVGTAEHVPRLQKLLQNKTLVTKFVVRGSYTSTNLRESWQSAKTCTQTLGDVALKASAQIANIPTDELGFEYLASSNPIQCRFGYPSETVRKRALRRWYELFSKTKEQTGHGLD